MKEAVKQPALTGVLLRLILGTLLSILLASSLGLRIASTFLPVLKWAYAQLDQDNDLVSLDIQDHHVTGGRDTVYRLVIAPHTYIYVGNTLVPTNSSGRGTVSVLIAYLWLPLIVALPLGVAWPVRRRSEWLLRAACLVLGTVLVAFVDIPTLLWSEVWSYYVNAIAPGSFSWLVSWGHFLKNGGQTLLGMVIAGAAISVSRIS